MLDPIKEAELILEVRENANPVNILKLIRYTEELRRELNEANTYINELENEDRRHVCCCCGKCDKS